MKIRKAGVSDCLYVASIHEKCLSESFLGMLGKRFLNMLYKTLIESDGGILIVAEDHGEIVGFVSGAMNTALFYKYFLKKNFFKAVFLLFFCIFDIKKVKKILETLQYSKKGDKLATPQAELLSMAVKDDYRGKGLSKRLFECLMSELKNRNIKEFKIVVGNTLYRAKKFYQKMGCESIGELEVHKGEISEVYVFNKSNCLSR